MDLPVDYSSLKGKSVEFSPTAILSVLDHRQRNANFAKRVIGTCLGYVSDGVVKVTNVFPIPFDEEESPDGKAIWYVDAEYVERYGFLMSKISTKDRIVGWYSAWIQFKDASVDHVKLQTRDLKIHDWYRNFCPDPVFASIQLREHPRGSPVARDDFELLRCYRSEPIPSIDERFTHMFSIMPSLVNGTEAESVGLEHLTKNLRDMHVDKYMHDAQATAVFLTSFKQKLGRIADYLNDVMKGDLPYNQDVLRNIQEVISSVPLPNVPVVEAALKQYQQDNELSLYVGGLTNAVITLRGFIMNAIRETVYPKAAANDMRLQKSLL